MSESDHGSDDVLEQAQPCSGKSKSGSCRWVGAHASIGISELRRRTSITPQTGAKT